MKKNSSTSHPYKKCWVCTSSQLSVIKKTSIADSLHPSSFSITDTHYGMTTKLSKCEKCSFIQTTYATNFTNYYEKLIDLEYEETRSERSLQAKKIIETIQLIKPTGKLLDVGAGSGILVEAAIKHGYKALGIEPSSWLQSQAKMKDLPVILGTFNGKELQGLYDIVMIIDVIEHVDNPSLMIKNANIALKKDGLIVIITPNVKSFFAKLLGFKWWHYRVAHIGYFSKKTLNTVLEKNNFAHVLTTSAKWYFSLDYLIQRLNVYLPSLCRIPSFSVFKKIVIPLDLHDSIFTIYRKK